MTALRAPTFAPNLALFHLREGLARGSVTPQDIVRQVYAALRSLGDPAVFIYVVPEAEALERAEQLSRLAPESRGALFAIPFAVKDNIDVAGLPTTAACEAFRRIPARTAPAVQRLLDAGGILIGKTNLDQFATGLAGRRSPFGTPRNPFDARYVPGGSSSGSAVSVAAGLVCFALGTDTAGSGRVPAAMNNVVGIKPTRGVISSVGVVPACRAQDCVSVFAGDVAEGVEVLRVMAGADPEDVYCRPDASAWKPTPVAPGRFRFGVPAADQLVFHDRSTEQSFHDAVTHLRELGGQPVPVDLSPFSAAARLLYGSGLVAQRFEATRALYKTNPEALHPVIAKILKEAESYEALDVHQAAARLYALRRESLGTWSNIDVLLVPTIPGPATLEQLDADPIGANSALGLYTNFVNLLDLCAVAIPVGFGSDGVPRGVTLVAPATHDGVALGIGALLHHHAENAASARRGATAHPLGPPPPLGSPTHRIAVAGAHMEGMALNPQLTSLGARLLVRTATAAQYRFYALATEPPKPGLVRVSEGEPGHSIEVEVWALSSHALGEFLTALPSPMCLGRVELIDGDRVIGFLVEPFATRGAREISHLGGWRRFVTGR
jgi:allophanate hydrolase